MSAGFWWGCAAGVGYAWLWQRGGVALALAVALVALGLRALLAPPPTPVLGQEGER